MVTLGAVVCPDNTSEIQRYNTQNPHPNSESVSLVTARSRCPSLADPISRDSPFWWARSGTRTPEPAVSAAVRRWTIETERLSNNRGVTYVVESLQQLLLHSLQRVCEMQNHLSKHSVIPSVLSTPRRVSGLRHLKMRQESRPPISADVFSRRNNWVFVKVAYCHLSWSFGWHVLNTIDKKALILKGKWHHYGEYLSASWCKFGALAKFVTVLTKWRMTAQNTMIKIMF